MEKTVWKTEKSCLEREGVRKAKEVTFGLGLKGWVRLPRLKLEMGRRGHVETCRQETARGTEDVTDIGLFRTANVRAQLKTGLSRNFSSEEMFSQFQIKENIF